MQRRYVYYRQEPSPRFPRGQRTAPDLPGFPDSDPAVFLICIGQSADLTCFSRKGLQEPVLPVLIGMVKGKESFGHMLAPCQVMVQ